MQGAEDLVVLIEDSDTDARLGIAYLAGGTLRIRHAPTAAAGLALITRLKPAAVLLDINLPDLGGLEVLERIRKLGTDTTVIVLSAESETATVVEAMRR